MRPHCKKCLAFRFRYYIFPKRCIVILICCCTLLRFARQFEQIPIKSPAAVRFVLTSKRKIVQLSQIHQIKGNHQLGDHCAHKSAAQNRRLGEPGDHLVSISVHFGVDVRVVGHLSRHVRSVQHFDHLPKRVLNVIWFCLSWRHSAECY